MSILTLFLSSCACCMKASSLFSFKYPHWGYQRACSIHGLSSIFQFFSPTSQQKHLTLSWGPYTNKQTFNNTIKICYQTNKQLIMLPFNTKADKRKYENIINLWGTKAHTQIYFLKCCVLFVWLVFNVTSTQIGNFVTSFPEGQFAQEIENNQFENNAHIWDLQLARTR